MSVQPLELTDGPWTAREVTRALFGHFTGQSWAPMVEVNVQPEERLRDALADRSGAAQLPDEVWERTRGRRVDMLLARRARKPGIGAIERLAIEVKVTRADFFHDVRNPYKQKLARDLAHRHAFAVPDGLITPDDVPAESGLLVVRRAPLGRSHRVEWVKRAPYGATPPGPTPDWLILTFAYRAAWAEAQAKGYLGNDGHGDDPEQLRAALLRMDNDLRSAERRAAREADKARAWRDAYAAAGGLPCRFCGGPLRPKRLRGGWWAEWTHVKRSDIPGCDRLRVEAAEKQAQDRYAAAVAGNEHGIAYYTGKFPAEPWRGYLSDCKPEPDEDQEIPTDDA